MTRKVTLCGFSIIEVSISLIAIGIISGLGITQLKTMNRIQASQRTQANIDFVTKSIAAYCIAKDMKLPYPSSSSSNIGFQSEEIKHSFGIVPFKTLGIMEKFAKDGHGRWLLYRMNPDFGTSSSAKSNLGISEYSSEIENDRVAFIIKSKNSKNEDEYRVWYSEKNFIANFLPFKMQAPQLEKVHRTQSDEEQSF